MFNSRRLTLCRYYFHLWPMLLSHSVELFYLSALTFKGRYTMAKKSHIRQLVVAVDIVAKVERVQLGRLCRKRVSFVARMSNVLSTHGRLCQIRQNRPWRIRLYRHCVPGQGDTSPLATCYSIQHTFLVPCDAMHIRPMLSCGVCLSVCPSVTFMYSSKRILKFFSPSGSPAILLFPYQTFLEYYDVDERNLRFSTNITLCLGNDTR